MKAKESLSSEALKSIAPLMDISKQLIWGEIRCETLEL